MPPAVGTPKSHAAERPPAAARESHSKAALLATEPTAPEWHRAAGGSPGDGDRMFGGQKRGSYPLVNVYIDN